jgi:hypothetical protein
MAIKNNRRGLVAPRIDTGNPEDYKVTRQDNAGDTWRGTTRTTTPGNPTGNGGEIVYPKGDTFMKTLDREANKRRNPSR